MDENKDGINTPDPSADPTLDPQGSTGNDDGKAFTLEYVDYIVESRLAKERKKLPPREGARCFSDPASRAKEDSK